MAIIAGLLALCADALASFLVRHVLGRRGARQSG